MSLNQKGSFLPILGVIILLIIVGTLAYYLGTKNSQPARVPKSSQTATQSPTSNPQSSLPPNLTEDWQTYTNTQYNYTLNYPTTWVAQGVTPGVGETVLNPNNNNITITPKPIAASPQPLQRFQIEVFSAEAENKDFTSWVEDTKKSQYYRVTGESSVAVAGMKSTQVKGIYGDNGRELYNTTTFLQTPDKKNFITILTTDLSTKTSQDTLNQILSSFRFIYPPD